MTSKQPLRPDRLRRIPPSFSWVDHRLIRDHHLRGCNPCAWALYLFPIIIGAANYGAKAGIALTCFATGLIAVAAAISGHPFASWSFFALSLANRSICLLAVALLVVYVRCAPTRPDSISGTGIGNY